MKKRDDLIELWTQLLRVQHESVTTMEAALASSGVSLATFEILYRLSRAPGRRLRMRALAFTLLLTPSGLSRAVEKGESKKLIERQQDDSDERGRMCILRPEGFELLKATQPLFFGALEQLFGAALTADEVAIGARLLGNVRKSPR